MSEIISRETADKLQSELSHKIQVVDETDAAIEVAKSCTKSVADPLRSMLYDYDALVAEVTMAIIIQRKLAADSAFREVLELRQPLTWGIKIMAAGYWLRCWLRARIEALTAEVTSL